MTTRKGNQLALPVALQEKRTFENFYPGPNQQLVDRLQAMALGKALDAYLYLWGHAGVGCSHLLQACYYQACEMNIPALYLSLAELKKRGSAPEYLHSLTGECALICIDDLDSIALEPAWQEALFYAYNHLTSHSISLIMAASCVPKSLGVQLSDLVTRLDSGLLFQVHELNDLEKLAALQLRAKSRGLSLPHSVAEFLLTRWARNPAALFSALNRLDDKALSQHRKLTIPFVKKVLSL